MRFNVLAKSGRAVEAAGDIDVMLLDKTGTITIGDRHASEFRAAERCQRTPSLPKPPIFRSLADETPEGRSIVALAREKFGVADTGAAGRRRSHRFTAQTRISGVKTQTTP